MSSKPSPISIASREYSIDIHNESDISIASIVTNDGNDQQREYEQTEHVSSPPPSPMQHGSEIAFHTSTNHSLAEVDSSVSFQSNENEDYVAVLRVRNIDPNGAKVIFKIKTTSPDKYRVKPTIGVAADRSRTAEVVITAHSGVSAGSMTRDRFQLLVARVPPDVQLGGYENPDVQSSHGNFQQLNNIFKRIVNAEGAVVETYRIGLKVEARPGDTGTASTGGTVSMNEERMKKGLEDLEKKITESVSKKVDPQLAKLHKLVYIILGLIICVFFLVLITWLRMPTSCPQLVAPATCSDQYTYPPPPVESAGWIRDVAGDDTNPLPNERCSEP